MSAGADHDKRASQPPGEHSGLEPLVYEALERWESGGTAALEAFLASQGAAAPSLRGRIEALREAGLLPEGDAPASPDFPERLGDFQLLERLGSGGMGVVYRARQESLSREVALKLVRPDQLYFPGTRDRFQREVLAAAKLQHPGIVPVYSVGEENGIPFFAMELVEGRSLSEVLRNVQGRRPQELSGKDLLSAADAGAHVAESAERAELARLAWPEACAALIRRAAEALAHAHLRGVLHRDVKPSNLMLSRDARLMLSDFGLASSRSDSRATRTGSQLGSLPYMAPEALRGETLDARSDVYALGVTLYELLALRPPYWAKDGEEIRRQVQEGTPIPISRLNPSVGGDLETVALAAMDVDARRRYASAEDFARDLANVLELRPIEARPVGAATRARRWLQRHPAAGVAIGGGILLLCGGPLAYGVVQARARERLDLAYAAEKSSRAEAERNLGRARSAVDTFLREVTENDLLALPRMDQTRRRLLERALEFYSEIAAEQPRDPGLALEAAHAATQTASILHQLGRTGEALAAVDAGEALLARAVAAGAAGSGAEPGAEPGAVLASGLDAHVLEVSGRLALERATYTMDLGDLESAEVIAVRALDDLARARSDEPDDVELLQAWKDALWTRATILAKLGRRSEAHLHFERAIEAAERLVELSADSDQRSRMLSAVLTGHSSLGSFLVDSGDFEAGRTVIERGLERGEGFDLRSDGSGFGSLALADMHVALGLVEYSAGDQVLAEELLRGAIARIEELLAHRPDFTEARELLATAWNNLAAFVDSSERGAERVEALDRAAAELRSLAAAEPGVPERRAHLAAVLTNLGAAARSSGDHARAREYFEEALLALHSALADAPDHALILVYLHDTLWYETLACLDLEDHEAAWTNALEMDRRWPDEQLTVDRVVTTAARCAARAAKDPALSESQQVALRDDYLRRGVATLARAAERGIDVHEFLGTRQQFDALRAHADYARVFGEGDGGAGGTAGAPEPAQGESQ